MGTSKLSAKMKLVEDAINAAQDPAMEFLGYRIQHGTLLEKTIPKAAKEGSADGASLDTWQRTAADLHRKMDNASAWIDQRIGELLDAVDVLELHVKNYNPSETKKHNLLEDDRVDAREKKKKAAIALIERAADEIKEIRKMLGA